MADPKTETKTPEPEAKKPEPPSVEWANSVIGEAGIVRNPSKGVWKGEYRVTGYALDPADDAKVKYLHAESVATFPPTSGPDGTTIPERPQVVARHLNPRWFKPNEDKTVKGK